MIRYGFAPAYWPSKICERTTEQIWDGRCKRRAYPRVVGTPSVRLATGLATYWNGNRRQAPEHQPLGLKTR